MYQYHIETRCCNYLLYHVYICSIDATKSDDRLLESQLFCLLVVSSCISWHQLAVGLEVTTNACCVQYAYYSHLEADETFLIQYYGSARHLWLFWVESY